MSKKAKKSEETTAAVQEALEALDGIQNSIEEINDEASVKLSELEQQYNAKKRPLYLSRNQIIAKIPDFWLQVFSKHVFVGQLLSADDTDAFKYLDSVDVEDFTDVTSGFKVIMTFRSNPYFTNKELTKEFRYSKDGDLTVTTTDIKWKAGKSLVEREADDKSTKTGSKRGRVYVESFFNWFAPEDQELELGEIIKDDIFPNPIRLYMGTEDLDAEFDFAEFDDGADSGSGSDAASDLGGQDV